MQSLGSFRVILPVQKKKKKQKKQEKTVYLTLCIICVSNACGRVKAHFIRASAFSSVQFSCSVVSDSLRPHGLQQARHPCPLSIPGVYSNSCPLSRWCHPTISSSVIPFSSCLQSFQHKSLFQVAKVLEFQLWHQSYQCIFRTDFLYNGLVGSPCSPRDTQESSPTPQFKSINSLALSFLYTPSLTSIHDYWKNHSFD